jgi:acetate kinase
VGCLTVRILTVNPGSTSLKLHLVDDGEVVRTYETLDDAFADDDPDAVAYRVVHGGTRTGAAIVDDDLVTELTGLIDLAPIHQPPALAAIERCRQRFRAIVHVACFDTAFHRTIPRPAATYAIPLELRDQVQVYGFHGLSHAWVSDRVSAIAPDAARVVVAHLGGGQSLCAVRDGRSVTTTMGFTPLDGLVMSTRSGSLDPGAVLWLAKTVPDVEGMLERRSGLVGLAGTPDMRELQQRRARGDPASQFAFEVWRHRAIFQLGGCIAVLGGLDALAFTGGIGEHDAEARAAILDGLDWLGVEATIESVVRSPDVMELSTGSASIRAFVVASREDLQMAREAARLLAVA